jgi:hypothetical protein
MGVRGRDRSATKVKYTWFRETTQVKQALDCVCASASASASRIPSANSPPLEAPLTSGVSSSEEEDMVRDESRWGCGR